MCVGTGGVRSVPGSLAAWKASDTATVLDCRFVAPEIPLVYAEI